MDKMIDIKHFTIELIQDSIKRVFLSDEDYFGNPEYKDYISNSRLKLINPKEDGSPKKFKDGIKHEFNASFDLGTAVHGLILEPDKFILSDCLCKPTAKLGLFIEKIYKYRQLGNTIYDSMLLASEEADYYNNKLSLSRIQNAIKQGLEYYICLIHGIKEDELGRTVLVLSEKQRNICINAVNSIKSNKKIIRLIEEDEFSLISKEIHNEDAFFSKVKITFPQNIDFPQAGEHMVTLNLKMKVDNWTFDGDKFILNDLKTTSKPISLFKDWTYTDEEGNLVKGEGSFSKYHYFRQIAFYTWVLRSYLNVPNIGIEANIVVVETLPEYNSEIMKVSVSDIKKGMKELKELLCRVAYCEIYGYENE